MEGPARDLHSSHLGDVAAQTAQREEAILELKQLCSKLHSIESDMALKQKAIQTALESAEEVKQQLNQHREELKILQDAIREQEEHLQRKELELDQQQQLLQQKLAEVQKNKEALFQLEAEIHELKEQQEELEQELTEIKEEMERLSQEIHQAEEKIRQVEDQIKQQERELHGIKADHERAEKELKAAQLELSQAQEKLEKEERQKEQAEVNLERAQVELDKARVFFWAFWGGRRCFRMLKLDENGPQGASSATGDAFARLLGGFFQTELRCPRCSKEWSKAEDFFSIRLPSSLAKGRDFFGGI
jgi:DNA repair exonuclease SbcCD ATPase subunit